MRTISENIYGKRQASVMDKISEVHPKNSSGSAKSCFYELGSRKAVIFGGYSNKPASKIVQNMRDHRKNSNLYGK